MHLFNGCYFSKTAFSLSGCQCDMQIYVSIVSSIDGFNSSHANAKIKIFNRFCLNSEQRFVFMCNRVCSWFSPGLIGTFHACYQETFFFSDHENGQSLKIADHKQANSAVCQAQSSANICCMTLILGSHSVNVSFRKKM